MGDMTTMFSLHPVSQNKPTDSLIPPLKDLRLSRNFEQFLKYSREVFIDLETDSPRSFFPVPQRSEINGGRLKWKNISLVKYPDLHPVESVRVLMVSPTNSPPRLHLALHLPSILYILWWGVWPRDKNYCRSAGGFPADALPFLSDCFYCSLGVGTSKSPALMLNVSHNSAERADFLQRFVFC